MEKCRPLLSFYRKPWPLTTAIAPRIDSSQLVEEERTPYYHSGRFYPARLGQVLNQRYQLAAKLGYGAKSTVWLAHDCSIRSWSKERYVAIKISAIVNPLKRVSPDKEFHILQRISEPNSRHMGWHFVRKLTDSFDVQGVSGSHLCLVMEPLRESLWTYRQKCTGGVIPSNVLKVFVKMTLDAMDYLHTECRIIHADLKPDNIMLAVHDPTFFARIAQQEYNNPLPQKHADGRVIYQSRTGFPDGPSRSSGFIQIRDFDISTSSKPGQLHYGSIQALPYRAPEVVLESGYTFSADIWSLGVLLWDLLEGKELFHQSITGKGYKSQEKAHLGQVMSLLGPPPINLVHQGWMSEIFYKDNGTPIDSPRLPYDITFDNSITCIHGDEKRMFISFVKRMIKWDPKERSTAKELMDDPWLHDFFGAPQADSRKNCTR